MRHRRLCDVEPKPERQQNSFGRGLDVLIAIARSGQATVAEVAAELEIPQSTVYRYIRSLRDYALIEESGGVYLPGWRLLDLGGQHLTHTRLVEVGTSYLQDLTDQTSETSVLAVRAGSNAICLRQVISPHPGRYVFRANELLPLYAGAGQRMLLAYAPGPIVDLVLERMTSYSPSTPGKESLVKMLEQARKNGYSISRGEFQPGAVAVSVPVIVDGELACTLTLAGPATRCSSDQWLRRSLGLLTAAAADLATHLSQK